MKVLIFLSFIVLTFAQEEPSENGGIVQQVFDLIKSQPSILSGLPSPQVSHFLIFSGLNSFSMVTLELVRGH